MEHGRAFFIIGIFLVLATTQAVIAADTSSPAVFVQTTQDLSSGAPVTVSTTNGTAAPIPGELIVKYKSSAGAVMQRIQSLQTMATPSNPLDRMHKKIGVVSARHLFKEHGTSSTESLLRHERVKRSFPTRIRRVPLFERGPDLSNVYLLKVPEKTNLDTALRELRSNPEVEFAQPNFAVTTQFVPNDPFYSSIGSWGQPEADLWGLHTIQAETAWDVSQGANVVIAVVDTGLDYTHPDIAANVYTNPQEIPGNGFDDDNNGYIDDSMGWDFSANDNDPMDENGHGTHTSGTIAAVGNNGLGIIGVAPSAHIMPVRALNSSGSGTIADLSAAIVYAAENGADVINNSWGCSLPCPNNPIAEDAVRYAHSLGSVTVFAAGNSASDIQSYSPQNQPQVIVVGASTPADARAYFSNFGILDVAAPGGGDTLPPPTYQPYRNILSLRAQNTGDLNLVVASQYLRQAGTSMSAPHVAGLSALILSANPGFTVEQVRQAIRKGADDIGIPGIDTSFGYGRINATGSLAVTAPLGALITTRVETLVGVSNVIINGIVNGAGLESWLLEYGAGTSPSTWTPITSGVTAVDNGTLVNLDLTTIPDGTYTLRLSAQSVTGESYEDREPMAVDQVVIAQPTPGTTHFYRSGDSVQLTGTVNPAYFTSYQVRVRDSNGVYLPNPDVQLANDGLLRVFNAPIATWNTAGMAADHYDIVLEVSTSQGTVTETSSVIVDPSFTPGWPLSLGLIPSGIGFVPIQDHLNVADVDGDDTAEFIIGYGSSVRILNHLGQNLAGWPQSIDPNNLGNLIQNSPAVGDVTGDGIPEIIASNTTGQVFVWNRNGQLLPGWPSIVNTRLHNLSVADINGDGVSEIIGVSVSGYLNVVDQNAVSLPGWPQKMNTSSVVYPTTPSIGDVDGDGMPEIVVMSTLAPGDLHVFHADGTLLPGWPININPNGDAGRRYISLPALGDLDGDGALDIVVGTSDGYIQALRYDGTNVVGWPQFAKPVQLNSPTIGDLDGDGQPEVIVGTNYVLENAANVDYLFAWHADGSLVTGWPVLRQGLYRYNFGFGTATLADIDNDGLIDVIASSDASRTYPAALIAYAADGSVKPGFPKPTADTGAYNTNTAAVADIDGDGLNELAWIDYQGFLNVWDLPAPRTALQAWPMFHHDAQHTGAVNPVPRLDSDGDGVPDIQDNCINVANADQRDSDGDGFGNMCDADLNNDGIVNLVDYVILRNVFLSADANADFNGDGIVNLVDYVILRNLFLQPPGPSGLVP